MYEALMFYKVWMILTKHKSSSLRSMKRREGVFSPKAQKRYVQKVILKERSVSLSMLQKAVPKGAQRKFSAQKSFLRECRAYIEK